jgi:tRNA(Ile2) C34 agmatinyltransferase TiaS
VSAAVLDRPARLTAGERRCAGPGPGLTLERRLAAVLAAAEAGEQADCPVCRGHMAFVAGEARCDDCGSRLS